MARFLQRTFLGWVARSPLALLCLLFVVFFFTACEEIEEDKPWIQVERPEMLFTDTTLLDSYDKGVLAWKLKTAYLERWGNKDLVLVKPVLVDIYDSLGERTAFLRADSGRMDMKFSYVYAYGHVYALTPKGASVRSDSLLWNKRDNLVQTESYVRVVSEDGDVLQGKGFVSDAHMDNWRILADVTGIFQDAAKRLKEEDKKEAVALENRDSTDARDEKKRKEKEEGENSGKSEKNARSETSAKGSTAKSAPINGVAPPRAVPVDDDNSRRDSIAGKENLKRINGILNRTKRASAKLKEAQ